MSDVMNTSAYTIINTFKMHFLKQTDLSQLSRLITTEEYQDLITTILFVLGHFWYMFFCNYLGQEVIDHSSNIFHKT